MSVIKLGYPAEVRDWLYRFLPSRDRPFVNVTPLDREHRRCPVYRADHYEVWSRYVDSSHELESLEQAFAKVPGVYMTTQVLTFGGIRVTNPDFPAVLGINRRGGLSLPGVYAFMNDDSLPKETAK